MTALYTALWRLFTLLKSLNNIFCGTACAWQFCVAGIDSFHSVLSLLSCSSLISRLLMLALSLLKSTRSTTWCGYEPRLTLSKSRGYSFERIVEDDSILTSKAGTSHRVPSKYKKQQQFKAKPTSSAAVVPLKVRFLAFISSFSFSSVLLSNQLFTRS